MGLACGEPVPRRPGCLPAHPPRGAWAVQRGDAGGPEPVQLGFQPQVERGTEEIREKPDQLGASRRAAVRTPEGCPVQNPCRAREQEGRTVGAAGANLRQVTGRFQKVISLGLTSQSGGPFTPPGEQVTPQSQRTSHGVHLLIF